LIVNDLEQETTYMQFQEKATENSVLDNFWATQPGFFDAPFGSDTA